MSERDVISIRIHGAFKAELIRELADEFIPPSKYMLITDEMDGQSLTDPYDIEIFQEQPKSRDEIKRELFDDLVKLTGIRPDWGILTGVRPVKLAGELKESLGSYKKARNKLVSEYYLTDKKAALITEMHELQVTNIGDPGIDSLGIYIGIPFCPTRCLYCSFASNQVGSEEVARYMPALISEIRFCGEMMKERGKYAESLYIGGGTPTTLDAKQLEELIDECRGAFDFSRLKEFTVEAGRPDTIDLDKLTVLKAGGVGRISINPQSMKQETLDIIGRSHTPEDIIEAFETAREVGFNVINADLIAGLPGEIPVDFSETLNKVLDLGANNITLHTLAVKRASRLMDIEPDYHYRAAERVGEMLEKGSKTLTENGFVPYYLYRQKHMAGWHENTGWCKPGTECIYNIRIMDEHQSILALGAGGISKKYIPALNRLERTANVTNYREYISRIGEMCERKRKGFFNE